MSVISKWVMPQPRFLFATQSNEINGTMLQPSDLPLEPLRTSLPLRSGPVDSDWRELRGLLEAYTETETLRSLELQLRTSGNDYWATQVKILIREVRAWIAQAANKPGEALSLMGEAADEEDAIEKLPVTPGPILPAREQLGSLFLEQHRPCFALKQFKTDRKSVV